MYLQTARDATVPRSGTSKLCSVAKLSKVSCCCCLRHRHRRRCCIICVMQRGLGYRKFVRLSVVKRVNCDKTKELSEKSSIITNRKLTKSFPMRLRSTAYVAPKPPKGGSKAQSDRFCTKVDFSRRKRKSATKLLFCKNFQRQSCRAFTVLSNGAQMIGRGHPLKRKFCS